MKKIIKKVIPRIKKTKIIWGIPLAIISLEIFFGVIAGYFTARFLSGKKTGRFGIFKSYILNIGKWRIHFHHWFIGLVILVANFFYNFLPFPQFSIGLLGGLIFQGISCYSDWHKILDRKE